METARPNMPSSPALGRTEDNPAVYRRIAPEEAPEAPVSDPITKMLARALAEELASNGRFIGRLAEAIAERLERHKGPEFTVADLQDATDEVLPGPVEPGPVVLPGPVPVEVPPEPAPLATAGLPRRPEPEVPKGSAAFRARKAWTQKNYYRRQKGLPELPRPESWVAPEKKDGDEAPPKTEDG
jgi:hypothetical protein